MESADKGNEPTPNVLLMLALAVGMWGLLYLGLRAAGPGRNPDIAVEAESVPQLANLSNQPQVTLPTRTRAKATRQRRFGPSLAARVFSRSTSLN